MGKGKVVALFKAGGEYLLSVAEINNRPYPSIVKAALLSIATADYEIKNRAMMSTPEGMFNKDGTLNKRKLDAKRRKDLRNGAITVGLNIKGE